MTELFLVKTLEAFVHYQSAFWPARLFWQAIWYWNWDMVADEIVANDKTCVEIQTA